MAPTQANRLDSLEEVLAVLQGEIPYLKKTMEEKFSEMKKYFEESQSKVVTEQNKKLDECSKGQRDFTAAITILMDEVKTISAKMVNHNEENPQTHSASNRERSKVEQNRLKEEESSSFLEELRNPWNETLKDITGRYVNWIFHFFWGRIQMDGLTRRRGTSRCIA